MSGNTAPAKPPAPAPGKRPRGWARRLWRVLCRLGLCALVVVAVYVTAGRLLMPLLAQQGSMLETRLSDALGGSASVRIGRLEGGWFRFNPSVVAHDVALVFGSGENAVSHTIERLSITLDVARSLWRREPVAVRFTVDGLHLALREHDNGRWTLDGALGGGINYTQQVLDFILATQALALTESRLRVIGADGSELAFDAVSATLANHGAHNALQARFRVGEQATSTQLRMHLQGDLHADYSARIYLQSPPLDLLPLLAGVDTRGWTLDALAAGGQFWLELDDTGLRDLRGRVEQLQVAGSNGARRVTLERGALQFALRPQPEAEALRLRVNGLAFDWAQQPWDIPALELDWPLITDGRLTLRAPALELELLAQIARAVAPLPADAEAALATLAPRGLLRNLHLETRLDGSYPGAFRVRGNLEDGAVEAWADAPAGQGLQGYIEATAAGGVAEVDSDDLSLHLPRLFTEVWHYTRVQARVGWQLEPGGYRVYSDPIIVQGPGLDGRVQFELFQTRNSRGVRSGELSLLVGVDTMDVAQRNAYLPRLDRVRDTMNWLQFALQGGRVRDSGFMLRTPIFKDGPPASSSLVTWYQVEDGRLRFLEDWPVLEDIAASVVIRDDQVDISSQHARIAGITLDPSTATLRPVEGGGSLLRVQGTASSNTDTGLAFLRETPVRSELGAFMDKWQASGRIDAKIALALPLGASPALREIAVDVRSHNSMLVLPDYALTLADVSGDIHYRLDTGLSADALSATLFAQPLEASIATTGSGVERSTVINAIGSASVPALRAWEQQPAFVRDLLGFMAGDFGYQATLALPLRSDDGGAPARLTLSSDLLGVRSELPPPLARTVDQRDRFNLNLTLGPGERILDAGYGDLLSAALVLDANGIERGQVYLGTRNRDFTIRQLDDNLPGLLVNGDLESFDFAAWRDVVERFGAGSDTDSGSGRPLRDYLRLVDLNLGTLDIGGQTLENINVQVSPEDAGWLIRARNALVGGRLILPAAADLPWLVDLDYLRLPPRAEPGTEDAESAPVDPLAGVDPHDLPAIDFSSDEISIGTDNLGAFRFALRPDSSGAEISGFRMDAAEASITDANGQGGATLGWNYSAGQHSTHFNGQLTAGNLVRLLPAWGHDANMESQSANFNGELQWPGSPLAFRLRDASGQVLMDIRNGRFVDIESSSSRLVGALNFDELVRRLQLDFSDLFQRGFAYDRISGDLAFEDGVVTPAEGIVIEGPSSRITINGEIDLASETIAADMRVRIPLGQNIAVLAGLLGAWPVAVSTYLASKIFQDQVDEFATVIYRLEGPWASPQAGFEPPPETAADSESAPTPATDSEPR